jgi:subtilase family serine protease
MRRSRFSLLAMIGVLLLAVKVNAQGAAIAPRITSPVNEKSLVTLQGNVPAIASAEFDLGEAAPSTEMSHVRLVLTRSAAQQSAMDKYDAELQDKSSPNYHKWLTPEQFGKLYGPADGDIAAIVAWLESHGLEVDPVPAGKNNLSFSGSVEQIQQLLHISIHSFEANGEEFLSNTTEPKIPAALAGVVSGVAHLNTIRPRPQHVRGQMGLFDQSAGRLKGLLPGQSPRAELTGGSGTAKDPYTLYIVAGDAATIYDTPNSVLNANFPSSGTSYTGKKVTIGIGGDAAITPGIVASYRTRFVGDSVQPTITNVDGVTDTTDSDEAYLDSEIAGGLAPGAAIHFYTAKSLDTAINAMVNDSPTVDIFSLSFGICELGLTTAENTMVSGWWQQAEMQGIAVVVSTGDNGSAGCDNNSNQQTASGGLMVNALASTPYNIAVGGTDFSGLASISAFTTYAGTTNSSGSLYRTAIKYIPESTWNDSVTVNTTLSQNVAYVDQNPQSKTYGQTNIVAGSGGKSNCSTNSTTLTTTGKCTNGYAKPTWQRGTGVPADSARDLPDVSLMSGAGGDNAAWLVCTADTGTVSGATVTADCSTQSDGHFYFFGFGGTSAATPAFAGMLALAQEKTGARLGIAAKELYDLYNGSHASEIFHDISVGNISVPCDAGTPDCATNVKGNLFLTGYDSETGYDLATGLGSVDVAKLVTYWGTAIGNGAATVTVQPSASSISTTDSLNVVATVAGSSSLGNPTGQVTLTGGGYTSPAQDLTPSGTDSGTYTFAVPGGSFAKGSDTLTVTYSGDPNYATQTGTAALTVIGLTPTVTVTPGSATLNSSASLTVTSTVTGTGATPTGTVTLTGGGYTSGAQTLDSSGKYVFTVPAFSFTTSGAVTLTVNYSGDANYNAGNGTAPLTIAVASFTLAATDVSLTAGATSGNTSTVTVAPQNGYTGTVTLTAVVTSSPSGAVGTPTLTGSSVTITDANAKQGTVTVGTTAAAGAVRGNPGSAWFQAAGGATLAALLLFFVPLGWRRGRRMLSVLLVVGAAAFTVIGCGGGGGGGGGGTQKTTPSVTVSPSKSALSTTDPMSVAISVSGGTSTATGTVTLTGGGFNSGATTLSSGAATINIPASSLAAGSDTLTASYSGDSNYNSATGSATVTVSLPATTPGTYTITVTGTDAAHATVTATTTFTLTVQ